MAIVPENTLSEEESLLTAILWKRNPKIFIAAVRRGLRCRALEYPLGQIHHTTTLPAHVRKPKEKCSNNSQMQKNIPNPKKYSKYPLGQIPHTATLPAHVRKSKENSPQEEILLCLKMIAHNVTQYCSATTTPKPKTEPRTAPPSTTKSTTLVRPGPKKGGTKYFVPRWYSVKYTHHRNQLHIKAEQTHQASK